MLIWAFVALLAAGGSPRDPDELPKQGAWTVKQRRDFVRGCQSGAPAELRNDPDFKDACECLVDKIEQRWGADDWARFERSGRLPPDAAALMDECVSAFGEPPKRS